MRVASDRPRAAHAVRPSPEPGDPLGRAARPSLGPADTGEVVPRLRDALAA
jgi:hypothetical protein